MGSTLRGGGATLGPPEFDQNELILVNISQTRWKSNKNGDFEKGGNHSMKNTNFHPL